MTEDEAEPKPISWLGTLVLVAILVITSISFILSPVNGPIDAVPTWTPALLFVIGLISIAMFRWLVLPEVASNSEFSLASRLNNCLLTSAFAAILFSGFSLPAAMLSGEGWIALPFAATGLLTWLFLSNYSKTQMENTPGEDWSPSA